MVKWAWWTVFVLWLAGLGMAYHFGLVTYVIETDVTHFSFGILGILFGSSLWIGWLTHTKPGEEASNFLWYLRGLCTKIGLGGTILGIVIMMRANFSGDGPTPDVTMIKDLISVMASGMGTAMTTTLVGLLAAAILEAQLVILEGNNVKETG